MLWKSGVSPNGFRDLSQKRGIRTGGSLSDKLEDPNKYPGKMGPDGSLIFHELLEEHDIELPVGPVVRTGSGGMHIYLRVPTGIRIRGQIRAYRAPLFRWSRATTIWAVPSRAAGTAFFWLAAAFFVGGLALSLPR